MQVNFDAERFVDYITRADAFTKSIRTKLAQAGVKGRPSSAPLPWFDLQGSPLDFDLSKALQGQPANAETLEALGQQVGAGLCSACSWQGRSAAFAQVLKASGAQHAERCWHMFCILLLCLLCALLNKSLFDTMYVCVLCLQVSLLHRREVMRKEHRVLLGLHELLTYGLKGVAAYAHHAEMLGKVDPNLDDMFEEVRGGGRGVQGNCAGVGGKDCKGTVQVLRVDGRMQALAR
jgi:hypothetical protein